MLSKLQSHVQVWVNYCGCAFICDVCLRKALNSLRSVYFLQHYIIVNLDLECLDAVM